MPHAYIFDAQLLMLEDPLLLDKSVAVIRDEHVNAEWALRGVSEQLHALFDEFSDAYLKERSTDLDDVLGRINLNLAGAPGAPSLSRLPGEVVLVAADLTPSEAAALEWDRVLALAIDAGSRTYHTALLARSLGMPAVVGLRDATTRIPPARWWWWTARAATWSWSRSQPILAEYRVTAGGRPRRGTAAAGDAGAAVRDARRRGRGAAGERRVPRRGGDRCPLRRDGHRAVPLRVPARPLAQLPRRGAADRRRTGGCWSRCARTRSRCAPGTSRPPT